MKNFPGLAAAMTYMLFTAAAAKAATFTFDTTVNLNPAPCVCQGLVAGEAYLQHEMFTVGVGDQITGTITIANGPVNLSGPAGSYFTIDLQFDGLGTSFLAATTSHATLGDLTGSLPNQVFTTSDQSGSSVFAQLQAEQSSPYNFSFSEFNYTVTVTSLLPQGTPAQVVQADYFTVVAGSVNVNSAIPEPGTAGLLAVGCIALLGRIFGRRCVA